MSRLKHVLIIPIRSEARDCNNVLTDRELSGHMPVPAGWVLFYIETMLFHPLFKKSGRIISPLKYCFKDKSSVNAWNGQSFASAPYSIPRFSLPFFTSQLNSIDFYCALLPQLSCHNTSANKHCVM